jgi:hypothetical protein
MSDYERYLVEFYTYQILNDTMNFIGLLMKF